MTTVLHLLTAPGSSLELWLMEPGSQGQSGRPSAAHRHCGEGRAPGAGSAALLQAAAAAARGGGQEEARMRYRERNWYLWVFKNSNLGEVRKLKREKVESQPMDRKIWLTKTPILHTVYIRKEKENTSA